MSKLGLISRKSGKLWFHDIFYKSSVNLSLSTPFLSKLISQNKEISRIFPNFVKFLKYYSHLDHFDPIWTHFKPTWTHFGTNLTHLNPFWNHFWPITSIFSYFFADEIKSKPQNLKPLVVILIRHGQYNLKGRNFAKLREIKISEKLTLTKNISWNQKKCESKFP